MKNFFGPIEAEGIELDEEQKAFMIAGAKLFASQVIDFLGDAADNAESPLAKATFGVFQDTIFILADSLN